MSNSCNPCGAKIVVIGGGTGSFVLLSGLKNYAHELTALVSMADDGGSTGVLRDEYGALPPGDVRQCLVALSSSPRVRELFSYRFDQGSLSGHVFGNLFLTALQNMTGSFAAAVDLAEQVLRVNGHVVPVTLDDIELVVKDGQRLIYGESQVSYGKIISRTPKIHVRLKKGYGRVKLNPAATTAIMRADLVVIAPGNLYGSIAPALATPGMGETLAKSPARKIYVTNLVNKPGQTDGYSVSDYAAEIERVAGKNFLDYVIYNTKQPSQELLDKYATSGELPVLIDKEKLKRAHYKSVGGKLLAGEIWQNQSRKDPLAGKRTLIRHDSDATARAIMKIFFS